MRVILAVVMTFAGLTAQPDPTNLDSMARYYHCSYNLRMKHPKGWLAIEKYVPLVYSHGRGPAPFNKVMDCGK